MNYRSIPFIVIYLLVTLFSSPAISQTDSLDLQSQLSTEELQEDFHILKSSLEDFHIGLYNYTPKADMGKAFDQVETQLKQKMSVLKFFQVLSTLNPAIANVHTKITPPTKMWTTIKEEMPLFPFDVYWDQGQLYLLKNLSDQEELPEGSIIKSINGQAGSEIFKKMIQLMNRDGYNQSYPVHRSCVSFAVIYAAQFGLPDHFELELIAPNGLEFKTTVTALQKKKLEAQQKLRYKSDRISWEKTAEPALSLNFKGDLAILRVRTFQEDLIKKKGQKYKSFLKKAFQEIEQRGSQHLVLDIRGNTGGQPEPTEFLLTYLLEEPFQICSKIEAKIDAISDETYFIKNGSLPFFEKRPWQKEGVYFALKDKSQFKTHQPHKKRFKGALFLLTDGFTSSAAGSFAGQIKSQDRATIVGEESGGNPNLTVARIIPKLELPNSKIVLSLPLIQSTKNVQFENTGRGVIPDHTIRPTIEDVLTGHDPVLEWIIKQL